MTGLKEKPILSVLRRIFRTSNSKARTPTEAEQLVLLKHDTDMFNRYEASRNLGLRKLDWDGAARHIRKNCLYGIVARGNGR